MEQKRKDKNSVKLTGKNTKVIKQEIKEENDNSKIIIVSLIIALLVALIAYVQFTKTDEEKENKKDDIEVIEKQDEADDEKISEEKDDDEYVYSYVEVVKPVVDTSKDKETSDVVNTPVEEDIYYSITFEVNGGNNIDDQILTQDETTYSVLPEREGWSFAGWYVDEDFSEEFVFGNKLESDITLYAKWAKFVKYVVDKEELDIVNTVSEGEIIPLLTKEDLEITDDSYEISWNAVSEDEYSNKIIFEVIAGTKFVSSDYVDSDTIVLEMNRLAKFEISFYESENSNEPRHTQKVVEGRVIDFTEVNEIIKADNKYGNDYEFNWYYLSEGIKFDFAKDSVANTSITKLYLSEIYKIIYNEKVEKEDETTGELTEELEEIGKQDVSKDSIITDVLEPEEKEDKIFDGWYIIDEQTKEETDQKLEIGTTIITGDLNVIGKWNDKIIDNNQENLPPVTDENEEDKTETTPVEEEKEAEEEIIEEQPAEPVVETTSEEQVEEISEETEESTSLEQTNE